jgi:hypothetical protein
LAIGSFHCRFARGAHGCVDRRGPREALFQTLLCPYVCNRRLLESLVEIAHRRGTPATSADALEGLAVVPGSLACNLGRFGFLPCAAARQAPAPLGERGKALPATGLRPGIA